ncbi:MAG: tetratricopeptide repeat protein [Phycisphaerales bacterium]|nr:MAG: tetratricopeptide repeat protein [Phycisphaerales bacterium]
MRKRRHGRPVVIHQGTYKSFSKYIGADVQLTNVDQSMNEAVQCYEAGRLNQAQQLCREILGSDTNHPDALHLLGVIAYRAGQCEQAIKLVRQAIAQNQQVPQFHNTLGVVLRAAGKHEQALVAYKQATVLNPRYAQAHHNMGNVFLSEGRYEAAVEKYNHVIALDPESVETYNSVAVALHHLGEYAAAIQRCNEALSVKPDYAEAHNTLASVLMKKGLCAEAISHYKHALQLKPDYAEAHCNLGMALLLTGRFEEGWAEYTWRLKTGKAAHLRRHPVPCWDGSPFVGRRLLVHHEQGFGDNIQFIRYLPMVKRLGGTVICEMLRPLVGLFRGFPGIDELAEASSATALPADFDFYIPLLELPRILGTTVATIPASVPYLRADPAKAQRWRGRFSRTELNIGIVWAGQPAHPEDGARSCHLRHFLRLSGTPGMRLFGLQKGNAAAQAKSLAPDMSLTNLGDELDDFADTAAVIENLDLVISVDTAVLHLAGAMAKPAWGILPFVPDWRWMLDRQDSPWYPTMRLFRQRQYGDWDDVFQRVSQELETLVGRKKAMASGPDGHRDEGFQARPEYPTD